MKYFPGTNTPANDQGEDQQDCCNQESNLQPEEWKDQQTNQGQSTHPKHNGKCHIIKMA